jgi:Ca-activated chloride channel family protein
MSFAWPHLLWLLILPYGLLAWELRGGQPSAASGRSSILKAEATPSRLSLVDRHAAARRIRPWLCAGLALAVVALARPQWGRLDEPVFDQSREILIALDLSRSMLTPDVNPSRLERAKLLIQSLLDSLAGERVGLVIFSGTAFLQAPMSADYEILREFLPSLEPDYLPVGGTNYGGMLASAAGAFSEGSGADRFLIVLSDGGATDEDWRSQLPALAKKGIRVIGLGVGTAKGGFIPDGAGGFMKDETGAVVLAKLENQTLQELADKTGGVYRDASAWIDLPALLQATVEAGRKGSFVERNTVRFVERYQWALAPALVCLALSFWWEFPVRPKPRAIRLSGPAAAGAKAAVLAGAALVFGACPGTARGAAVAGDAPPASGALLGRMAGRLSSQDRPASALDWAEFAGETVKWGQSVQSSQQPVPANPVRDALAAVDLGAALDPRVADWEALRSGLNALLQAPEDKPKPQPKDQPQSQQLQNPEQQQSNQQQQSQPDSSPGQGGAQKQSQPQNQNSGPPPNRPQNAPQSAFGDLKAPPPPAGGTQQVGGGPPPRPDPARADPNLAMPLQRLDEVRNQDSPAELFQMLQDQDPKPAPAQKGRDW